MFTFFCFVFIFPLFLGITLCNLRFWDRLARFGRQMEGVWILTDCWGSCSNRYTNCLLLLKWKHIFKKQFSFSRASSFALISSGLTWSDWLRLHLAKKTTDQQKLVWAHISHFQESTNNNTRSGFSGTEGLYGIPPHKNGIFMGSMLSEFTADWLVVQGNCRAQITLSRCISLREKSVEIALNCQRW